MAVHFPEVNGSDKRVLTNFYSVPVPVGGACWLHSAYVEIWHQGQCSQTRTLFQATAEGTRTG